MTLEECTLAAEKKGLVFKCYPPDRLQLSGQIPDGQWWFVNVWTLNILKMRVDHEELLPEAMGKWLDKFSGNWRQGTVLIHDATAGSIFEGLIAAAPELPRVTPEPIDIATMPLETTLMPILEGAVYEHLKSNQKETIGHIRAAVRRLDWEFLWQKLVAAEAGRVVERLLHPLITLNVGPDTPIRMEEDR